MAFFVLIPIYWITSILIYAASPRQQIARQHQKAILPPYIAWVSFSLINIACFIWLIGIGWSTLVAGVNLLLLNMLMIPVSIIFLAHNPSKLKPATLLLIAISTFAQIIA